MCPTVPTSDAGKHHSGQTSTSTTSGGDQSGKHRPENWDGGPVGSRQDRPHHPDGWTAKR